MSEENIILLIFAGIGYIACFFFGYYFSEWRRSTRDTDLCDQLTRDLEEDQRRVESTQTELTGVIDEGERVKDILRQYTDTTSESKKLE